MNYQKLVVVGNVAGTPSRRVSKKGDVSYVLFSVGVSEGKEESIFFPCAAFGKLGETVERFVSKGRGVLVEGRITLSAKGRFGVIADKVVFGAQPQAKTEKR
jgi:single-stranded DNA-binding protein